MTFVQRHMRPGASFWRCWAGRYGFLCVLYKTDLNRPNFNIASDQLSFCCGTSRPPTSKPLLMQQARSKVLTDLGQTTPTRKDEVCACQEPPRPATVFRTLTSLPCRRGACGATKFFRKCFLVGFQGVSGSETFGINSVRSDLSLG